MDITQGLKKPLSPRPPMKSEVLIKKVSLQFVASLNHFLEKSKRGQGSLICLEFWSNIILYLNS